MDSVKTIEVRPSVKEALRWTQSSIVSDFKPKAIEPWEYSIRTTAERELRDSIVFVCKRTAPQI